MTKTLNDGATDPQQTIAELQRKLAERTAERDKMVQQQTATADVLKAMSSSAFDLDAVMHTLASSATELCAADLCGLYVREGDFLVCRGYTAISKEQEEFVRQARIPADATNFYMNRALSSGEIANIGDFENDRSVGTRAFQEKLGFRSLLIVPLMREGHGIGLFVLGRDRIGEFSLRHIELVQTFADQAVIAIENVRLFNETQEALEQQTATAEVLQVISNSISNATPVFERILESTERLITCDNANIFLAMPDEQLHLAAFRGPDADTVRGKYPRPLAQTVAPAVIAARRQIVYEDVANHPDVSEGLRESARAIARGTFSVAMTPLIWEGNAIGMLSVSRDPAIKFNQKELSLLRTFADQAVIAIQNARLFNETQEALERQTATADILKVIASSPDDVQPVFEAIAFSANRLIGGFSTAVHLVIDDMVNLVAFTPTNPESDAILVAAHPRHRSEVAAVALVEHGEIVQIADSETADAHTRQLGRARGWRGLTLTPLMNQSNFVGFIASTRRETGVLGNHHVELLRTFADQAVIAIENARLFEEVQARTQDLQESLEYQTATSDVLKVISRSSFDLQPVLDTLVDTAVKLCGALNGTICLREGDGYRYRASSGIHGDWARFLDEHPPTPGRSSLTGRVLLSGRPESVPDVLEDLDYVVPLAAMNKTRSVFGVPLLRYDKVEGVLLLARAQPGLFTQRQIELVQTFADQAVIAIENARLLTELRQRTGDLTESLEHLRTAQDRLVQTEKLASLGQLTAGIAHEIKNPLNFVNNFSALSVELIDEMTEVFENLALDEASRRKELDEIRELLKSNLEKVVQHGRRADSIVKNMLLHSREASGEQRPADINALLDESLNLAYHGARAEKPGFNITLHRDFDPAAGAIDVFPQEMTRAFINLISNGFYAASKHKAENGKVDFEPVLSAATKNLGSQVEIRIRDNGTGIPPEVKEKMFNPFFTTKPSGEGTGLGLSMSHDIIVKQHGGRIEVETEPGRFTEFKIVLPRASQR